MWSDFKKFAFKGNIFDLAIGVVIGSAFGKIVSSLVENIITPLLGLLLQGIDFSEMAYRFPGTKAIITYGVFLQSIIDFLIIAFSIFIVMRFLAKFKIEEADEPDNADSVDAKEELLKEIRDLLKAQQSAAMECAADGQSDQGRTLPPDAEREGPEPSSPGPDRD